MLFLPFLDDFCSLSFSMPGEVAMGVCSGKNQAAMLMWYICGTGIKTSGETTLAPSNFVHLVHGVQSGWKMKIDGLVRLSKGWFQDNPCHSVFIVLTSCLNVFAVCSPAVRRLPWWRRGQDDLMPRSSMQQQCN